MKLALVLLPFLALAAHAEAPVSSWDHFVRDSIAPDAGTKLLATAHVGAKEQAISIPLVKCGDTVKAVNLKIKGADVNLSSFGLKFSDGESKTFPYKRNFTANSESGWIDLSVLREIDPRCVTQINAIGTSPGKATVLIYGEMK